MDGRDPLSVLSFEGIAPLSSKKSQESTKDEPFESWNAKKSAILAKYTTSESLSISVLCSDGDKSEYLYKKKCFLNMTLKQFFFQCLLSPS